MKKILLISLALVGLVIVGIRVLLEFAPVQNLAMERLAAAGMAHAANATHNINGLHVFVCGSASPLPSPNRAQACIAVLTPEHFYLIDSGAGSTANLTGLPMDRLQGIFITHFHSDHIAEIPEVNLRSWVQGRGAPLQIIGPVGVAGIVTGLNNAYALDRQYRVAHHGSDLLPPAAGLLEARTIRTGVVLQDGELTVSAYSADHTPIYPAVGYRIDYKGRSVVISGDSKVTKTTRKAVKGADLLLHDALSEPVVTAMAEAAGAAGLSRNAKILTDILDYHAWTSALIALEEEQGNTNARMVAYYHLVPSPRNLVMRAIFERDLPDNYLIAEDGMWFDLPVTATGGNVSSDIIVSMD